MSEEKGNYIYILTNPSFPEYVKIGYADDVEERVDRLNKTECTPFGFRIYASYKCSGRLQDFEIHDLIDDLNPSLRSIDHINGKIRKREFYAMSPEDALKIFKRIAKINGLEKNIKIYSKTQEQKDDEKSAKAVEKLALNRHHFKEVEFSCSLTGHRYKGRTNEDGVLEIIDLTTNTVIPNNANPSKKTILGAALEDLDQSLDGVNTTYQRYRLLQKILSK